MKINLTMYRTISRYIVEYMCIDMSECYIIIHFTKNANEYFLGTFPCCDIAMVYHERLEIIIKTRQILLILYTLVNIRK